MELIIGLIIIAVFIIVMFTYVTKVVQFIKTDKTNDNVKKRIKIKFLNDFLAKKIYKKCMKDFKGTHSNRVLMPN